MPRAAGGGLGYGWLWDIRSVNGKGLDLRLRVPDWIDGLELALRAELQKALGRGNVSLTLKVARTRRREAAACRLNAAALSAVLAALGRGGGGGDGRRRDAGASHRRPMC